MKKKVSFNLEPKIYFETDFYDDYQNARNGSFWEQQARDRCRFKKRIELIEILLNKVLIIDKKEVHEKII